MDFYQVRDRVTKSGVEVYPDFTVRRSSDLMVRGGSFYAIWDEEAGLWSTDEFDVQRLLDADLYKRADELESPDAVSYTHLRAHETRHDLVCRLLLEKKKKKKQ